MTSIKVLFLISTICVVTARTIPDDPDPHLYGHNTPSPPFDLNQGEVVMKEAILYLTPSQIKAYEASQGQNTNQDQRNHFTEEDILNVEAEVKRQLEKQNIFAFDQSNPKLKYPKVPPPVVEEPISENPIDFLPQFQQSWKPVPTQQEQQNYFLPPQEDHHSHKFAQSYSYIKFFTDHDAHETPKLQLYHPIPHEEKVDSELAKYLEVQKDPVHNKQYKLVPYEYKTLEVPRLEDVREITKLTSLLEKYNNDESSAVQRHQYFTPANDDEKQVDKFQKELAELKYAPNFEAHRNIDDAQRFQINIEKENALARAEAILKAPPAVARKEVVIKRRPITYHGKDRHHLVHRHFPETKKEIPLDISVHRVDKPHRHVWKH